MATDDDLKKKVCRLHFTTNLVSKSYLWLSTGIQDVHKKSKPFFQKKKNPKTFKHLGTSGFGLVFFFR